jgi:hypothetical protein
MELTRTHKIFLIALAVAVVLAIVVLLCKKPKKAPKEEENYLGDEAMLLANEIDALNANIEKIKQEPKMPSVENEANDDFPLSYGSKGKRVEQLQAFLVKHYGADVIANGTWDEKTQTAVEKHLKQQKISKNVFDAYNLSQIKTSIFK